MGSSNSCLSGGSLSHRNFSSKVTYDVQEAFSRNNTNTININNASEDELLFLPGIGRDVAQNIIQYRITNNGFKQINDLLKIDGITLDIFKRIYDDVTVDLSSSSASLYAKPEPIDLNSASYEQLCSIPNLTPKLAKRINARRNKKGGYRFIEDLLKIKGIDYVVLATIRPYVTLNDKTSVNEQSINTVYQLVNQNPMTTIPAADTFPLPAVLLDTLPAELQSILISSPPYYPTVIDDINKKKTFRFASWNLQRLTNDKVQNPGVREVICRIILENNFSLIGVQDMGNKEALDAIVEELNNPKIPLIKQWSSQCKKKWKSIVSDVAGQTYHGSEYLGFLYDESFGMELKQDSLFTSKTYFTRSPYVTIFRLHDKFEFVFVNIHFKSKRYVIEENNRIKDETKALSVLAQVMNNTFQQKYMIILGSFNIAPAAGEFEELLKYNYSYVIQQNTDIGLKNLEGTGCLDNIWLSGDTKTLVTGNSGVIRDHLSNLWIPNGWTWGGLVSNHCPVWSEFDLG